MTVEIKMVNGEKFRAKTGEEDFFGYLEAISQKNINFIVLGNKEAFSVHNIISVKRILEE